MLNGWLIQFKLIRTHSYWFKRCAATLICLKSLQSTARMVLSLTIIMEIWVISKWEGGGGLFQETVTAICFSVTQTTCQRWEMHLIEHWNLRIFKHIQKQIWGIDGQSFMRLMRHWWLWLHSDETVSSLLWKYPSLWFTSCLTCMYL